MKIINNQNPRSIQVEMTEAELVFLRWLMGKTASAEKLSDSIYNATIDYASPLLFEYDNEGIHCAEVEKFIEEKFVS